MRACGGECVVGVSESAGAETDEIVEHLAAQQLNGIAGKKERDLMTLLDGSLADQEAERGTSRVLGPASEMDQQLRHAAIVAALACGYLGGRLAGTRIQLCGRLTAEVDGRRIETELPGRQGRLLFAFLVANRLRPAGRDELIDALWPGGRDGGLSPLLSKLRRLVMIEGRSELRLVLPAQAWIDLEAASDALHRAEAAIARHDWPAAWGPARVAQHIARRSFLAGESTPWIEESRRRLEGIHLRSLELVAEACLQIGGGEIDTAERAARTLVRDQPFRETGWRLLMQILDARGNRAEALTIYDELRTFLREELGCAPSATTQELYRQLLG